MTRHHAESNINILLTRNLSFDSGVRQLSHILIMPLYCFWAKSNNRTCGRFEYDVTWSCFCFDFVRSHAQCDCCAIVCWRGCGMGWRGVRLKLDVQGEVGGKNLDVDGQGGGGGSCNLDNIHGHHMCIVPYYIHRTKRKPITRFCMITLFYNNTPPSRRDNLKETEKEYLKSETEVY